MNHRLQPLSEGEVKNLLNGINNARDQAIIRLMLDSGLRISEVGQLDRDSIKIRKSRDFGTGRLVDGKHGPRVFPVFDETLACLWDWLASRRDRSRALFVDSRGQRLSVRAMRQRLRYWSKRLGLGEVNAHRLRHTCAARLIHAGVPMPTLGKLLGSKPDTLEKLIPIGSERLIREYRAEMKGRARRPKASATHPSRKPRRP
jgi:integrase